MPELLLVAAILVALGTQVIPQLRSADASRLELAVSEVTAALRYARDESAHTGAVHSVELDTTAEIVRVVRYADFDALAMPPPVVFHPLSRQPYQYDLDSLPSTAPTQVASVELNYDGVTAPDRIDFSAQGLPHYIRPGGTRHRLLDGRIELSMDGIGMGITVDPLTGRITPDASPTMIVVVGP
ncbi:MAG: pilus assembly FimT family protein [Pseudomonadales bacterium]